MKANPSGLARRRAPFCLTLLFAAAVALPADSPEEREKLWDKLRQAGETAQKRISWPPGGTRPTQEQIVTHERQRRTLATWAAETAREYYATCAPTDPHALDARKLEIEMQILSHQLGSTALGTVDDVYTRAVNDTNLPTEVRLEFRLEQAQRRASLSNGTKERNVKMSKELVAINRQFAKNQKLYENMWTVAVRDPDAGRLIAQELLIDTNVAPATKTKAREILDGKFFYASEAIGKPITIQFTAVDGREVDLAKMKGKVIAVHFWANWAGFTRKLPVLQKLYEQRRDAGFEVIGINFDTEKQEFLDFTREKAITWPQFFDGNGWQNRIGAQYNIWQLPTTWLIDKKGNLREIDAKEEKLAEPVEALLKE